MRLAAWICCHCAVPTHVGVNRPRKLEDGAGASRPHARGGEPKCPFCAETIQAPSPRTWG